MSIQKSHGAKYGEYRGLIIIFFGPLFDNN